MIFCNKSINRESYVKDFIQTLFFISQATSNIEEFNQGRRFQKIYAETYPESLVEPKDIRRVLICSGQVYYDLLERRRDENINV